MDALLPMGSVCEIHRAHHARSHSNSVAYKPLIVLLTDHFPFPHVRLFSCLESMKTKAQVSDILIGSRLRHRNAQVILEKVNGGLQMHFLGFKIFLQNETGKKILVLLIQQSHVTYTTPMRHRCASTLHPMQPVGESAGWQ